ncbi:TRAP transporter substrate-binding protein [Pseudomonas seleniipraecipitans]|uniref:TRAP transporter substrate-binding protein n=1 Tax=Phytopseudomonas seleniipraecipitans TaxID=640205 RepID=A0ABY5JEM4_9GAMM|nr:TRAP transporter substrate-binding protein [Pseudomonas seleniipraecipitans]UUD65379.1 TRAP transporter substrate-binding protein [Pseudomonas seleniipraecipitans]
MSNLFIRGVAALSLALLLPGVAAQAQERTFKLSAGDPIDAPGPQGAKLFAEHLKAGSDGALNVKVFPSAMIGNDVQMLGALPAVTVEFALVGAPTLVGLVKDFGVLDLPYQFNSTAEVDAMLDGPMGQQLLAKLEEKGLVGLGFWEIGFRNLTNSKRPIEKWEDLKGLKIRTVQSPIFRTFFDHLGANAQPMPINEVFGALEMHAIDGQENPVSLIATQRYNEVQDYLTVSEHIYTAYVLLMSKKTWDSLDDTQRAQVRKAAEQARSEQRQLARQANSEKLAELKASGMQVNTLTDEQRQRFVDQAKVVTEQVRGSFDADFVKAWQAELQRVREAN